VALATDVLAVVTLGQAGSVTAGDSARSTFTVVSGGLLLSLDSSLNVLADWVTGPGDCGTHAALPQRGLALISGFDEVRLLDRDGQAVWRHAHKPWDGGSGCAWFSDRAEPCAVVPAPHDQDECVVRRFDLHSGQVLAETRRTATPGGIVPVLHPDGWAGLSVAGPETARAWWVRSREDGAGAVALDVLDAGWDDWVLADANLAGTRVITLPCDTGPLLVRSFPSLEIIQSVSPPKGHGWGYGACFADDLILVRLVNHDTGADHLAAVDDTGALHDLGRHDGLPLQAADGTWLSVTPASIIRCRVVRD
jgi:hypothetical protein